MGKIADRLAQKRNPLYAVAKDIISIAEKSLVFDEHDDTLGNELEIKLKSSLEKLSRTEFSKLLDLIDTNTDGRLDGVEIFSEILDTLEFLGEDYFDGESKAGRLVVIPMAVDAKAAGWDLVISPDQMNAIADVLKEFDLVGKNARVTFMPRLLNAAEGQIIGFHEAHEILNLLVAGKARESLGVVTQTRLKEGMGFVSQTKPSDERRLSCCLLVAYVETDDEDNEPLLPFADKLDGLMGIPVDFEDYENDEDDDGEELGIDPDFDEESLRAMMAESMSDVEDIDDPEDDLDAADNQAIDNFYTHLHETLASSGKAIASVLATNDITLLDAPVGWFDGVGFLARFERNTVAEMWIKQLVETSGGDIHRLGFRPEFAIAEATHSFLVQFFDKATLETVGNMTWPALYMEDVDDCQEALDAFLSHPVRGLV